MINKMTGYIKISEAVQEVAGGQKRNIANVADNVPCSLSSQKRTPGVFGKVFVPRDNLKRMLEGDE